ncbi:hypothetical protein MNB_SV-3-344 [hydrothermal vent metagenome]|uniref:Outer membrane porin, OprD family n=1 Tax=hydrothermal vent metagenome TaxID=652676 RepID=A0A1W1CX45_9ZZZZ
MHKITLSTVAIMIMSLDIYADVNITQETEVNTIANNNFIKNIDGYVRTAYENHNVAHDKTYTDAAIGGKLHIESTSYYGVSIGSSFYTSNALGTSDNRGLVPFRGKIANSYSILGEAYIQAQLGNTLIKIGRQEIETPFAQVDDIGIVPNTFEAYIVKNNDIKDTTLFLGQIQKMAGVDAKMVDGFTRVNGDNNMQVIGITYEGIENLNLNAWYYHLKDAEIDNISYIEANYETQNATMGYGLGVQYSKQTYTEQEDASIYGLTASLSHISSGITLCTAYNKVEGNAITSGFGGGPFFSNSEYLIIDNAGANGSQTRFGLEFDGSAVGIDGLTLGLSKVILKNQEKQESTELDVVASYEVNKHIEMHMIYSDLDGKNIGEDTAKHLRVFANYTF